MKKKSFQVVLFTSVLMLSAVILFAGGSKETDEAGNTQTESKGKPTLSVIAPALMTDALKQGFQDFETQTGYKIDIQQLPDPYEQAVLMKWSAGERPDILLWHGISNWLRQLRPTETMIDLSSEEFVDKTKYDLLKDTTMVDGKVYGAVLNYPYSDGIFYNKEIFQELGLDLPKNYEDLKNICGKIKTAGYIPIYSGGGVQWPLQLFPFLMWSEYVKNTDIAEELNTNKTDWTDKRIVQAMEKMMELVDLGYYNEDILTATFELEQEMLMSGKTAMVWQGSWIVDSLVATYGLEEVNKKVGFASCSVNSDLAGWQVVGTGTVYVPKTGNSEKERGALEFVRFMTGDYFQTFLNNSKQFPILEGYTVPDGIPEVSKEANEFLLNNSAPLLQVKLLAHYGPFETFLQEMVAGTKTPMEVGEALEREFTQNAKQQGLPGF